MIGISRSRYSHLAVYLRLPWLAVPESILLNEPFGSLFTSLNKHTFGRRLGSLERRGNGGAFKHGVFSPGTHSYKWAVPLPRENGWTIASVRRSSDCWR